MAKRLVPFGFIANSYSIGKLFGKLMLVLVIFGFIGSNLVMGSNNTTNSTPTHAISSALCGIYSLVHTVIFIVGLVLIILGGAMYAGAHVLPGNLKGSLQGYGIGMIVGGIAGVIIAMSAPYIMGVIAPGQTNVINNCAGIS
ncbi:MAG: hypothetical protein QXK65_01385 [Candidatus Micrarchaeaceae archaeon]